MFSLSLTVIRFLGILSTFLPYSACISTPNITSSVIAQFQGTRATPIGRIRSQSRDLSTSIRVEGSQSTSITSGFAAADKCWAQWDAYTIHLTNCGKTTATGDTTTRTETWTSIIDRTYKLCDGHPRAVATGGERTWTSTGRLNNGSASTTYFETLPPSGIPLSTATTTVTTEYTYLTTTCASSIPAPQCSIHNEECHSLFDTWTAGGFIRPKPPCTYTVSGGPCNKCWIYVPSVQLIYFPVSMTGDFCGQCKLS